MTQQIVKSLQECNTCKAHGHPSTMISFQKTDRKKPDGKVFWDLINADSSPHVHKSTQTEIVKTEKPTPRPSENISNGQDKLVIALENIAYELHTMVMAQMMDSEASRAIVKARLMRSG